MGSVKVSPRRAAVAPVPARRLPLVVRWVLRAVAATLASVVIGFLVGLARPRPKDPGS